MPAFRSCTTEDYPALSAIQELACCDAQGIPIAPITVEDFQEADQQREPHCRFARWVAEEDNQIVGWAEYDQAAHRHHPQKFWVDVYVHPEHQSRGIGGALYDHVLEALTPFGPICLRCDLREDELRGISFLQQRGWQEAQRTWASTLDVTAFDPAPYEPKMRALLADSIHFQTLRQLETDPERDHKLYELVWEIRQDLPDLDAGTKEPFHVFVSQRLNHADLIPDAYIVALQGERYAGYIYHFGIASDPNRLRIGQLGVARADRGRGIAQALKVQGVLFAREHGYTDIKTTNRSDNVAMLAINERMGFVRQHAWLHMLKSY